MIYINNWYVKCVCKFVIVINIDTYLESVSLYLVYLRTSNIQVAEYERMSKDLNRSAYTKRIMEIVGNIRKQKMDIDKVKYVTLAVVCYNWIYRY